MSKQQTFFANEKTIAALEHKIQSLQERIEKDIADITSMWDKLDTLVTGSPEGISIRSEIENIIKNGANPDIEQAIEIPLYQKGVDKHAITSLARKIYDIGLCRAKIQTFRSVRELPSPVELDKFVQMQQAKMIGEAHANGHTDISEVVRKIHQPLEFMKTPYEKLCAVVATFPYCLDPRDLRYISLTDTPIIRKEDALNLRPKPEKDLTIPDFTNKMLGAYENASVDNLVSILTAFQQKLEGRADVDYHETLVQACSTRVAFKKLEHIIDSTVQDIRGKNRDVRTLILAGFYGKVLQLSPVRGGIKEATTQAIQRFFESSIKSFPQNPNTALTSFEMTAEKIYNHNFASNAIRQKFGVAPLEARIHVVNLTISP